MVDRDEIRMAFSERSTKETPELVIRLWYGYYTSVMGPTLPPIYSPGPFHHEPS